MRDELTATGNYFWTLLVDDMLFDITVYANSLSLVSVILMSGHLIQGMPKIRLCD
jgi:hypothetical protein